MSNIISKKTKHTKEWTQEEMDSAQPVPMPTVTKEQMEAAFDRLMRPMNEPKKARRRVVAKPEEGA